MAAGGGTLRRRSVLLLPILFAIVVAATLWHHEMWMDEMNAWLIARDASSLASLLANMHGESHPPLWYLLLYGLTRLTSDPRAMQALHLIIATASITLIAYASPFSVLERCLLAFSYFFVYEFAVISRGYAAGVLLALAICALYAKARPSILWLAVLLALLANTSAYGILLVVAILAGMIVDRRIPLTRTSGAALGFVLLACFVAGLFVLPAPGVMFGREWHRPWTLPRTGYMLNAAWAAYVPLPDFRSTTPWNSNLLFGNWNPAARHPSMTAAILGLAVLALVGYALRRQRAALATYLTGTALMLALIGLKYSGGMRHHGHLFILLIVALWMGRRTAPAVRSRWAHAALVALLVPQVVAGIYFVVQDLREPFSVSKEVAAYVSTLPRSTPVVVVASEPVTCIAPELSGYLRHPVNLAMRHRIVQASFAVYDSEHYDVGTPAELVGVLDAFAQARRTDVCVVTENWWSARLGKPLAQFDHHLEGDEGKVAVYRLRPPGGRGALTAFH